MIAPLTSAHFATVRDVRVALEKGQNAVQIIANREAEAVAPIDRELQNEQRLHAATASERDQLRAFLYQCYAATGEDAGSPDDFRALLNFGEVTVSAVRSLHRDVLDDRAEVARLGASSAIDRDLHRNAASRAELAENELKHTKEKLVIALDMIARCLIASGEHAPAVRGAIEQVMKDAKL